MVFGEQLGMADNVGQTGESHLGKILAHFLGKEGEIVDQVFVAADEMAAQFGVLSGNAHGAGVLVALTHHDAAQHNQCQCAHGELVGAEQGHHDDVVTGLQLTIGLQAHLTTETVPDQCLLSLGQSDFGRYAGKAHAAGGRCSRAALGTADDDEVGLGLGHTGGNSAHSAFGHELNADGCLGVDVLQVEDELCKVFDGVDVVVGWRRDERDAGNAMARTGNHFVHLEARQLSALAGLGALSHLDLYLFGVYQVFGGHAETSRCHLLGLAGERDAVDGGVEALVVFASLTGVAAGSQFVHGQADGLVGLFGKGTEAHGTHHKVLHDAFHGFHLRDVDGVALEVEEVADEDGRVFLVGQSGKLFVFLVVAGAGGQLQGGDGLGVPGVADAVFTPVELSEVGQERSGVAAGLTTVFGCLFLEGQGIAGNGFQSDAADGADAGAEIGFQQTLGKSDALENLGTAVAADGGDAHLGHDLQQCFLHGLDVVGLGSLVVFLHLAAADQVVEHGKRHVGTEGAGTVAQQQGGMHGLADFAAFHDECRLHALAHGDEIVVDGAHGQQRGDIAACYLSRRQVALVGKDDVVVTVIDSFLGILAELVEGHAEVFAGLRIPRFTSLRMSLEDHRQLDGVETLVPDVTENVELGVVQDGMGQSHHLAVGLVGVQDASAHASDIFGERHHEVLADGVDGRVGDLGELLTEIVEEHLWLVGEHGERRVVAHGCRGFLSVDAHRHDGVVDVFATVAEHDFLFQQTVDGVGHVAAALQFLELYAIGAEPLTVGMLVGELFLDFSVVVDAPLLGVYEQDLARLQASFLSYL